MKRSDNSLSIYNLSRELEIETRTLHSLERQYKKLEINLSPKGLNKGRSYEVHDNIHGSGSMTFADALRVMESLRIDIVEQINKIKVIELDIKKIDETIKSFKGLKQKVKYMQLVEGKSLREIARELDYNYGHIRKVAMNK
jgi:precorrin isomerase